MANWDFLSVLLCLSVIQIASGFSVKCNRTPGQVTSSKSTGDGGFAIQISGNPEKYIPGEVYTVSIQGPRSTYSVKKFTGFLLVVEPSTHEFVFEPQSVGSFQLYGDIKTMHSEDCPNAIMHTSKSPKTDIQVRWTAPPAGSGCLKFKATVVEQRNVWYMDDGELTKELCEEDQETDDMQPEIIKDCCACDEAKYEVTFEGLWSRQTHPKDFPKDKWLTHFSDLIGASHSNEYFVWKYGGYASQGLKEVAQWGSTRELESELKRNSKHIRTNIKARGLWYPDVNKKTFAVFRVDNRHHLMSVVSMLGPSPDWIVGVSGLELCLKNCSWVKQKKLNLYPYDAGTDSGVTYMSSDSPSIPRQKITRITTSFPNNPKSPFYDPKGRAMNPLARLTVTRQRVYKKTCSDTSPLDDMERHRSPYLPAEEEDENDRPQCRTSKWSEWTPCSITCGKGLRFRTRFYTNPFKADMFRCTQILEETEMCPGAVSICEGGSIDDIHGGQIEDPLCSMSLWSSWTPCSASCGTGSRQRHRRYKSTFGRKRCSNELIEKQSCVTNVECPKDAEENTDPRCAVTQWSNFSPCSMTCGKGIQIRKRYFLSTSATESSCKMNTTEKIICMGHKESCTIDPEEAKRICLKEMDAGPCRGSFERWYYNSALARCVQFHYGGCRGNRNNFKNYDDCIKTCENSRDILRAGLNNSTNSRIHFIDPYEKSARFDTGQGLLSVENLLGPQVDCLVSAWSDWSECSATCGRGWKERRRVIERDGQNGGKVCPKKLVRRQKCKMDKCTRNHKRHNLESLSSILDPALYSSPILPQPNAYNSKSAELGLDVGQDSINEDCVMGEWGPWSPCTHSCGSEALQQRARSIVVKSRGAGTPCGPRFERRYCSLPPCSHLKGW